MRISAWSSDVCSSDLVRSKETTEQVGLMTPNAEILSRAAVPGTPSFPPTNLILVLAAFLGFGGGILLALLVETLDQTLDRKSVVQGKRVSVRVGRGGRSIIKKQSITKHRSKKI